ncbi:MAG: dUTP diphosphatase [archaeon]
MQKIKVKIKKIHPDAKMPFYAYEEAAAFDLYSVEEKIIPPEKTEIIRTGLTMEIQPGYCLKFRDRSGLGAKGITHFGGLIDSDYRGEFKIILHNTTSQPYKIEKGDRIIQVLPTQTIKADFEEVQELSETARGESGFHSTGKNDDSSIQNYGELPSNKRCEAEPSSALLGDGGRGLRMGSSQQSSNLDGDNTEIIIISGVARNNIIGNKNKLPWHISKDLKRFKELTWGNPVVMGRATYLSILEYLNKPLPGRTNIVITDNPEDKTDGFIMCHSIDEALAQAKQYGDKIYVIGGASIYKQLIPKATKLEITHIHKDFEGDVYFQEIDKSIWRETKREDIKGENLDYSFVTYEKNILSPN